VVAKFFSPTGLRKIVYSGLVVAADGRSCVPACSLQPVKWQQIWLRSARYDVNLWRRRSLAIGAATSVVVWVTRRLGLEMVIAFRGRRRYNNPYTSRSGSIRLIKWYAQ
jgi:hypothetical protein